jgi:hypothetical protein
MVASTTLVLQTHHIISHPSTSHNGTTTYFYLNIISTMKIAALTLFSTLAVAAGFAPGFVGRHSTPLFMAEDTKTGTVKWWVG